ncbi:MAG: AraC family transcriptional regulator, partial [Verrucomicrobiota bacterium]
MRELFVEVIVAYRSLRCAENVSDSASLRGRRDEQMGEGKPWISLVPPNSPHEVVGDRRVILPSLSLDILSTRLIELKTWTLRGLNDPFWRLYLPVRGEAEVWAGLKGEQEAIRLTPNSAYLIPPRTTITSRVPDEFTKWYVHFSLGGSGDRATAGVYPVQSTPRMKEVLEQMSQHPEDPYPWLSFGLVAEALEQVPTEIWTDRRVDPRVEHAMEYLRAHLARKLSSEEVAKAVGVSVRNLHHLFHKDLQMTPMRVLLDFRLDRACRLLRHGNESIEQIAEHCGFANRYYFSRMMKKYRGVSPGA